MRACTVEELVAELQEYYAPDDLVVSFILTEEDFVDRAYKDDYDLSEARDEVMLKCMEAFVEEIDDNYNFGQAVSNAYDAAIRAIEIDGPEVEENGQPMAEEDE